jgi:hypothetical protein
MIISFPYFTHDSKNNLGKSNEGIATEKGIANETPHSTTTTTPRTYPVRSLALAANS